MSIFSFLKKRFSDYYKDAKLYLPDRFGRREWGFMFLGENFMQRHIAFQNQGNLRQFLSQKIPAHVYHSSAYYETPDAKTMSEKNWLGADLIFDIDCDHISTPCKKTHDLWMCLDCSSTGKGETPHLCPKCGGGKLNANRWICERCLEKAKHEALKLTAILEEDFGVSSKTVGAVFSGHRGYHIHVAEKALRRLGSAERKEIVDYVTSKKGGEGAVREVCELLLKTQNKWDKVTEKYFRK